MKKHKLYIFGTLLFLAASCQKPDNPVPEQAEAPKLVSVSPENGAEGVMYGSIDLILSFDAAVMCPTARRGEICIDNGASISKIDANGKNVTLTLGNLEPSSSYTVTLPEGTVIGYK